MARARTKENLPKLIGAGSAGVNKAARQAALLEGLRLGLRLNEARGLAHIGMNTPKDWRKRDPEFAKAFELAVAEGVGVLANEARIRAVEGVKKPVFHRGMVVQWFNPDTDRLEPFYLVEKSDTLLMFLLKSRDPETYCDRVRAEKIMRRWRKQDAEADDKEGTTVADDVLAILDRMAAVKAAKAAPAP